MISMFDILYKYIYIYTHIYMNIYYYMDLFCAAYQNLNAV